MSLFQIVEVASHMLPACGLLDAAVLVELIEARVGIRLQAAAKLAQMPLGMPPFASTRSAKVDRSSSTPYCASRHQCRFNYLPLLPHPR